MKSKEYTTEHKRISSTLVDYIKYIQKRHKEEYRINLDFTEASFILAERAKNNRLFN